MLYLIQATRVRGPQPGAIFSSDTPMTHQRVEQLAGFIVDASSDTEARLMAHQIIGTTLDEVLETEISAFPVEASYLTRCLLEAAEQD